MEEDELNKIERQHPTHHDRRLIEMITFWIQKGPRPWRTLVFGLKKVKMLTLAEKIATDHSKH